MLVVHLLLRPVTQILNYGRAFVELASDPYRPELHYMRGPGPKWRAKHQVMR